MKLMTKILSSVAGLVLLCGCMTPPVQWRHDMGTTAYESSGEALMISPIVDHRPMVNEEVNKWRNWVPFVLWTTEYDQAFEMQLARTGTERGAQPAPDMYFDGKRDLVRAIHDQLGHSNLFGPVFKGATESGTWEGEPGHKYSLQMDLNKMALETRWLRYGLGPLAPVAFALGAPKFRYKVQMNFSLVIKDEKGQTRATVNREGGETLFDGWCWKKDGKQRVLDFISDTLGEGVEQLEEVSAKTIFGRSE